MQTKSMGLCYRKKKILNTKLQSPPITLTPNPPQLIRDMKAVSEATNWSQRSSTEAKYTALRCDLQPLTPGSSEFCRVRDQILNSQNWYGNQTLPEITFDLESNSSLN